MLVSRLSQIALNKKFIFFMLSSCLSSTGLTRELESGIFSIEAGQGLTVQLNELSLNVSSLSIPTNKTITALPVNCGNQMSCSHRLEGKICAIEDTHYPLLKKHIELCQHRAAEAILIYDDLKLGPNNKIIFDSPIPVLFTYDREFFLTEKNLSYQWLIIDHNTENQITFECSAYAFSEKWVLAKKDCLRKIDIEKVLITLKNKEDVIELFYPQQVYFQPDADTNSNAALIELTPALLNENIDKKQFSAVRGKDDAVEKSYIKNKAWIENTIHNMAFLDTEVYLSAKVMTEKEIEVPYIVSTARPQPIELYLASNTEQFKITRTYCEQAEEIIPKEHINCWAVLQFSSTAVGTYHTQLIAGSQSNNVIKQSVSIKALSMSFTPQFTVDSDKVKPSSVADALTLTSTPGEAINDEETLLLKSTILKGDDAMKLLDKPVEQKTLLEILDSSD